MTTCIFCQVISGAQEHFRYYESSQSVVFLDRKPINPGHSLIVPKQHTDYFFDLAQPVYDEMFRVARTLEPILRSVTHAARIGLVVSGFGVHHAHLHLVPLHGDFELDPDRARPAADDVLLAMQEKLIRALKPV